MTFAELQYRYDNMQPQEYWDDYCPEKAADEELKSISGVTTIVMDEGEIYSIESSEEEFGPVGEDWIITLDDILKEYPDVVVEEL